MSTFRLACFLATTGHYQSRRIVSEKNLPRDEIVEKCIEIYRMAEEEKRRKESENVSREISSSSGKNKKFLNPNLVVRKRQPFGVTRRRNNDIYVTNRTPFKAQLSKCEKFFNNGASEVIIHALGAAINRACNLALRLKDIHHGSIELDIKTSTVRLIDDLEPLKDEDDYEINNRNNSSIHIRVYRKAPMGTFKYTE